MEISTSIDLAKKREWLCKNSPRCPKCKTQQVQLKDWIEAVIWKCRICKHKF